VSDNVEKRLETDIYTSIGFLTVTPRKIMERYERVAMCFNPSLYVSYAFSNKASLHQRHEPKHLLCRGINKPHYVTNVLRQI